MLTIRHRTGPLAGREQAIDDTAGRILFGRDADVCNVVFPPEETLVSRRHFALERKPSGAWTFDLFGDPYVAVNGDPAEVGKAVHNGDVIELGRRGGPSFEVIASAKELPSRLAPTQAQQKVEGSQAAAARARRLALVGVALAVIAGGSAAAFMYFSASQGARLDQALASLASAQAQAASESIGPAVRDKLLQASHVVVIRRANGRETAMGTASPIGSNILATNAHIAEEHEKLKSGERMLVRSPGPSGKTYEVIESRKHPGYDAFTRFLDEDPFFVVSSDAWLKASVSYDVATLRVADGSNLGPIIEIASAEELAALKAGTPLVMAGYPLENIPGREVQAIGATPTLSVGMVTALTDMFNLPADPAYRRLVVHNLPGTGGNSGSPMLTGNGKLAALHNAGSYINVPNVGRVPNAALIRFGQRADYLLDLLSGRADATLDEHRAYWAKQTAAFKRGFEVVVPYILSQRKPSASAAPTLSSQARYALAKADQFSAKDKNGKDVMRRQKIHGFSLKAGRRVTYIAYAQEKARIQLYLVMDGKIVQQDDRNTWFPDVSHISLADSAADVYVVGGDQDVNYTLAEYVWDAPRS